jgi:hypothetical protein
MLAMATPLVLTSPRMAASAFSGEIPTAAPIALAAEDVCDVNCSDGSSPCMRCDTIGLPVLGLGALNKAEFVNGGGARLIEEVQPKTTRLVHGNTLTGPHSYTLTDKLPDIRDLAHT